MVDLNNSEIDGTADASTRPVLDAVCMAELRALDPDGKAQLVRRVLETYQTSLVKLMEQLRQARADDAWDQVSRVAHTLKSSSASIGALPLSSLCAEIEKLLRAGDNAGTQGLLERFPTEVARARTAVATALAALQATAS